jgi:hypothetical protein
MCIQLRLPHSRSSHRNRP